MILLISHTPVVFSVNNRHRNGQILIGHERGPGELERCQKQLKRVDPLLVIRIHGTNHNLAWFQTQMTSFMSRALQIRQWWSDPTTASNVYHSNIFGRHCADHSLLACGIIPFVSFSIHCFVLQLCRPPPSVFPWPSLNVRYQSWRWYGNYLFLQAQTQTAS